LTMVKNPVFSNASLFITRLTWLSCRGNAVLTHNFDGEVGRAINVGIGDTFLIFKGIRKRCPVHDRLNAPPLSSQTSR
jgi:hypothetical protein